MDVDELRYGIKHSSLIPHSVSAMPNSGKTQAPSTSGNILLQTIIDSPPSQETMPSSSHDATQDMTFNEYIQWHQASMPSQAPVPESCESSSTIIPFSQAVGGEQSINSESSTEIHSISSEPPAAGESLSSELGNPTISYTTNSNI